MQHEQVFERQIMRGVFHPIYRAADKMKGFSKDRKVDLLASTHLEKEIKAFAIVVTNNCKSRRKIVFLLIFLSSVPQDLAPAGC